MLSVFSGSSFLLIFRFSFSMGGRWMRNDVLHELKDGIKKIYWGTDKGTKEEGYFHSIIKQRRKAI